ncbi:DNA polymerase beta superfamily protein [Halalkalibacter akibai]|uniref:Nucleotidyltransferase n=1 Tax=Halalkalibacter akibai (strain ATCC 43226 / DSM 21942 / CIP 109018 / JCM 9157 / 1139) TaxID=1236973 RepID=W4QRY9_HALA3|nr:nucleotidyltransferase domain-containing protein [Halalkalibacter akibai]GAE34865.1 hypothetical protein JCM9157_1946 [Halalkalibacter akibai JCM 9157]
MNRKLVFKALVGSGNYHLSTPESDKDYKIFVLPFFQDLYNGKVYTRSVVGKNDEEIHDIRKLNQLFWKSNVNFVEVLFSIEIVHSESEWIKESVDQILALKKEIASMNLPYLYKACKGMFLSKSKYIETGNQETKLLVEKFGYDTKSAMHTFRILDFIERYADNEFTDFKKAIQYNETEREFLLKLKQGAFTQMEFNQLIRAKVENFEKLEAMYQQQPVKEDVKAMLEEIIYKLVANSVQYELNQED